MFGYKRILLVLVNLICLGSYAQSIAELFKSGKEQFGIGNYQSALDKFDNAIKANPSEKEVCFYAGLAAYNLKDYTKAVGYFSQEIKNDEQNPLAYIYRAKANNIDFDAALKDLKKAETLSTNKNFMVYQEMANLYYSHAMYKKAFKANSYLLELKPGFEEAYYKMGFCKYYLKDTTAACAYWKKIDDLDDFAEYELIEKTINSTNQNHKL